MNRLTLFLAATVFLLPGCKPDEPDPVGIGGIGGAGTLKVTPRHHTRAIDSCTIYIRYNATNAPANGVYDDSARCVPSGGLPVATFSGLKKGKYYIYGYGWDPSLSAPGPVKGAFAYLLSTETVQTIDLAVTEDH